MGLLAGAEVHDRLLRESPFETITRGHVLGRSKVEGSGGIRVTSAWGSRMFGTVRQISHKPVGGDDMAAVL